MDGYRHDYIEHLGQSFVSAKLILNCWIMKLLLTLFLNLVKTSSSWKWRRICCIPIVMAVEIGLCIILAIASLLIISVNSSSESQ